ncbi:HPr-rel-A system PqqD family peptide chaperone [Sphingobium sp.]|uniref:HPr-rel-A system PqqD family peptide chaperone n=1 Tax=Sphingobium sp. TaxID=1912891 RepID=UPI003BB700B8
MVCYRRDAADAVRLCVLADIVLLYHPRSGQTHMVISPVPEILDRMGFDEAIDARAMHDRLAQDFDLGPADVAMADIAAHLDALVDLGLVRPA